MEAIQRHASAATAKYDLSASNERGAGYREEYQTRRWSDDKYKERNVAGTLSAVQNWYWRRLLQLPGN